MNTDKQNKNIVRLKSDDPYNEYIFYVGMICFFVFVILAFFFFFMSMSSESSDETEDDSDGSSSTSTPVKKITSSSKDVKTIVKKSK